MLIAAMDGELLPPLVSVDDVDMDALRDLITSLWLFLGRHDEQQLTLEQKELLADVVEASAEEGDPFVFDRWWRR
jgi:hypothetical protein